MVISFNYINKPKNLSLLDFKEKVVKIFIHGFLHLLDFDQQIYGQRITVEFVHKIRDEQQFTSIDDLAESISEDVKTIEQWFLNIPK